MRLSLSALEARVLGSLIEKSLATPDQYPLSLNALVNACNQKTSREPVMHVDETLVARALATLKEKNLAGTKSESGNRVPRFFHRVENLLNGGTAQEIGIACVLLLRGPQTPGEIKQRTDRLCTFESTAQVEMVLNDLAARSEDPLVERLSRQPGQKETRFRELFTADRRQETVGQGTAAGRSPDPKKMKLADVPKPLEGRLASLEARVAALEKRFPIRLPNEASDEKKGLPS